MRRSLETANAHLYTPETTIRVRNNMNPPTPWPPDMATGKNPPNGAIIDYYLGPKFKGDVTVEIDDAKGGLISKFSSTDPIPPFDPRYPDPAYWARPPLTVPTTAGHHRFLWDMRYQDIPGMSTGPDAAQAVPDDTPSTAASPFVMPGTYTVKLIAGGKTMTAPITIVMDPRVKTSAADLAQQFAVSKSIYDDMQKATVAIHEITVLRDQLRAKPTANAAELTAKLNAIAGAAGGGRGGGGGGRGGGPAGPPTLGSIRTALARTEHSIQNVDRAPTPAQIEAAQTAAKPLAGLLQQWEDVKKTDLKAMNMMLQRQHLPLLTLDTHVIDHDVEDQIELGDIP